MLAACALFQSSAAPKDGCYDARDVRQLKQIQFQSSAAPKDGCYEGIVWTLTTPVKCFNPQPPRRTAATVRLADVLAGEDLVSILSRPEGRLLPLYLNFVSVLRERPLSRLFQALFPPPCAFIQV